MSQASAIRTVTKDQLALGSALSAKFSDNARKAVLLVGNGLHQHLSHGGGGGIPLWEGLVKEISEELGLPEVLAKVLGERVDLTYAWETLASNAGKNIDFNKDLAAHQIEEKLLKVVLNRIQTNSYEGNNLLDPLVQNLFRKHRDIVTLNFDRTIDQSLESNGDHNKAKQRLQKAGPKARAELVFEVGNQRVWHPHGFASSSANSATLQLGFRAYAHSVQLVNDRVEEFRKRFSSWKAQQGISAQGQLGSSEAEKWEEEIRSLDNSSSRSWVDVCMTSDIVIVGCSLHAVELDIWTMLNERQRQFLRMEEDSKPKVFFLHKEEVQAEQTCVRATRLKYLKRQRPSGIITVGFKEYADIWGFLMRDEYPELTTAIEVVGNATEANELADIERRKSASIAGSPREAIGGRYSTAE